MAEAPEEVTVVVDAEDRASPTLLGVGRNIVMLGTNLAMISKELGISNPALNAFINAIELVGHVVRLAYEVQYLYSAALQIINALTAENVVDTSLAAGATAALAGTEAAAIGPTYGLAGAFAALRAAMGDPTALMMLIGGLAIGGFAGYALGGGMGGGAAAAPTQVGIGGMPAVQINIGTANMSSRGEGEAFLQTVGVHLHQQVRTYRS